MNLTNREKATLVLDPRTVWNPKVSDDEGFWIECKDAIQPFYRDCHVQTKAHHRKNTINNNAPSPDCTDSDDSDDSEPESDSSTRLLFARSMPNDSTNDNRKMSETQKRINDGEVADK